MKAFHRIIPIGIALAAIAQADEPKSVIRFANDDVLYGFPEAIKPRELVWNSPLLARPATFLLDKVLELWNKPNYALIP